MRRQIDRVRQALCPVAVLVDWLEGGSCETTADLAADAAEGLATARDALHTMDSACRKLAVAHGASVDASAECLTEIAETLRRGYALQDTELARVRKRCTQLAADVDELAEDADATWRAIGVDPHEPCDDPDVERLCDAVRVSIEYERDKADEELARLRSQLAQQAAELSTARAERDRARADLHALREYGADLHAYGEEMLSSKAGAE